jgi:hypothetical protein
VLAFLWFVFLVFLALWLLGLVAFNWGAFLWVFLAIAVVILLFNIFTGTRAGRWY